MTKRKLYSRRVGEYWVIDLDARIVERWRLHGEQPEIVVHRLEWHPAAETEAFALDLDEYFASVFREDA